jgi:FMN phosphatase YigB (HAD superfamily)/DNA-binding XRE family transcriptional regulator
MDEKGLGERLQKARKAAGLTQQELCQKSGLSYSTLAKIERGAIKSPSIFTIQQIAGVLNTTVDDLLSGESVQKAKKKSKNGTSFVYFDINGCLVRFYHRAFAAIAHDTGISSDIVELTCWRYNDAVCRGDITLEEYNNILAQAFGVEKLDWSKYYLDAVDGISEAYDAVLWASEHFKVGLLSNIMPGLINGLTERGYIPDITYDAIIDSSQVKVIKPESKIFEIATQKAGVEASEILLIDDSRANLMAAERAGWRVLWFDDYVPTESVRRIRDTLEF